MFNTLTVSIEQLHEATAKFCGGKLQYFYENWSRYTQDSYILGIIKDGLKLDLIEIPFHHGYGTHPFSLTETNILQSEIGKLIQKKVIVPSFPEIGDFVSGVFTRPKKDGSYRLFLNLKKFNEHIHYKHFKMESIQHVINVLEPGHYMASIDLKDAFFSVPIYREHQKYLKFKLGSYYKFICMPNGYGPAMRIFTKITKIPFSYLRKKGYISVVFVDDSYLQGKTYQDCVNNVIETVHLLQQLGFTIHPDKSILTPTQQITFLGFDIDSEKMTMSLTKNKKEKIIRLCSQLLHNKCPTIRELAQVIGNIVASFPAVTYGPLHYRSLELDKIYSLRRYAYNFDKPATISPNAKMELLWWISNIQNSFHNIIQPKPDIVICTDASMTGWGVTDHITSSGGFWSENEISHINILEIKAIFIGVQSYCKHRHYEHIRVMCDNTTAISYINKMGGTKSSECNRIAKQIWEWCITHKLWISAAHIPGIDNYEADYLSRPVNDATEWQLNPKLFHSICNTFQTPDVDLFASRINKQVNNYISWQPEPDAIAVDAFSVTWTKKLFYIFPPFSLIGKITSKILADNAHVIIVVPDWPTQYWYPKVMSMINTTPMIIKPDISNLRLTHKKEAIHPLYKKLQLLVIEVTT